MAVVRSGALFTSQTAVVGMETNLMVNPNEEVECGGSVSSKIIYRWTAVRPRVMTEDFHLMHIRHLYGLLWSFVEYQNGHRM